MLIIHKSFPMKEFSALLSKDKDSPFHRLCKDIIINPKISEADKAHALGVFKRSPDGESLKVARTMDNDMLLEILLELLMNSPDLLMPTLIS